MLATQTDNVMHTFGFYCRFTMNTNSKGLTDVRHLKKLKSTCNLFSYVEA